MTLASTVLPNGVRILSRAMSGRRSAALGVWIRGGVRGEGARQNGYAHLLEHLLFRRHRVAYAALGGDINAMTSREWSVLHGLVPADTVSALAGLFADTLCRPHIDTDGLESERRAIQREIAEYGNDLGSSEAEYVLERVWNRHPMARPILGEPAIVHGAGARELAAWAGNALDGAAVLVSAAGAIEHCRLVEACAPLAGLPRPRPRAALPAPRFTPCAHHETLSVPGSRLLWVLPMPPEQSEVALSLGERIAAGGIGGLLQRTLRERLGLVYGIHSELERYSDCGLWWLRLTCAPRDAAACRHAVEDCFETLCGEDVDTEDFERARAGLRAQWTIEDDDASIVMQRIALECATRPGIPFDAEARQTELKALAPAGVRAAIAQAWEQRAVFSWGQALKLKEM